MRSLYSNSSRWNLESSFALDHDCIYIVSSRYTHTLRSLNYIQYRYCLSSMILLWLVLPSLTISWKSESIELAAENPPPWSMKQLKIYADDIPHDFGQCNPRTTHLTTTIYIHLLVIWYYIHRNIPILWKVNPYEWHLNDFCHISSSTNKSFQQTSAAPAANDWPPPTKEHQPFQRVLLNVAMGGMGFGAMVNTENMGKKQRYL